MPAVRNTGAPKVDVAESEALYEKYEKRLEGSPIDMDANQIRRRIRTFIDSGAMKVGEFQRVINVNTRSWHLFMTQTGANKGIGSTVFANAWVFFKGREMEGLPMPRKPRVVKGKENKGGDSAKSTKSTKKSKSTKKTTDENDPPEGEGESEVEEVGGAGDKSSKKGQGVPPSVDDIHLDGEDEDKVPIYETCDQIRRHISSHLQRPGVTQTSFLREIANQFRTETRKIQSKQLSDFRSRHGELDGNSSCVFYGSWCYFEKLRIKEGKPVNKNRQAIIKEHGKGGVTRARQSRWITVSLTEEAMMMREGWTGSYEGWFKKKGLM